MQLCSNDPYTTQVSPVVLVGAGGDAGGGG
jgi:hypothetical protein